MSTTHLALKNNAAASEVISSADWDALADGIDDTGAALAAAVLVSGILNATDLNGSIVAGQLQLDVSSGFVVAGPSGSLFPFLVAAETVEVVASATNYVYVTPLGALVVVQNPADAPANSHLAISCVADGAEVTSVNNLPTGRKNLGGFALLGGHNAWLADQSMGGFKITSLADPASAQDAATKNYVDATALTQRDMKQSVRAASTANVNTSSPGSTLDGVTLVNGDRILLKDQSTGSQNGLYTWAGAAVALTRATDADTSAEVTAGLTVAVEEGTVNADTVWMLTANQPITLGTTSLTFTEVSASPDGTTLQFTSGKLGVKSGGIAAAQLADAVQDALPTVTISVGSEAANVIRVTVQFKDLAGNNLAQRMAATCWLSDTAHAAITGTAPSGGWAAGTSGVRVFEYSAGKMAEWETDAAGLLHIDITETGAKSFVLQAKVGNVVYASSAITFA